MRAVRDLVQLRGDLENSPTSFLGEIAGERCEGTVARSRFRVRGSHRREGGSKGAGTPERVLKAALQSRREHSESPHPVAQKDSLHGREFLPQELIAFPQHSVVFECAKQGQSQIGDIPRFADVFVDGAGVDSRDSTLHVRIGGHKDSDDVGEVESDFFEKLDAGLSGHALVRHQEADFSGVAI